jgi:hypothetical protein
MAMEWEQKRNPRVTHKIQLHSSEDGNARVRERNPDRISHELVQVGTNHPNPQTTAKKDQRE